MIFEMTVTSGAAHLIAVWVARLVYKYPFHASTVGRGCQAVGVGFVAGSVAEVVEILIRDFFSRNHDYPYHLEPDRLPVLSRRVRVAESAQCFYHGPSPAPFASVPLLPLFRLQSVIIVSKVEPTV